MKYPTTGPEVYTDIRLPNQAFGERKLFRRKRRRGPNLSFQGEEGGVILSVFFLNFFYCRADYTLWFIFGWEKSSDSKSGSLIMIGYNP